MKKEILSIAAAICMVFGTAATLPPGSFTESASLTASAETFGDFEYKVLKDETVEIHKYTGNASTLSIPSKIGGREVTNIAASAFLLNETLSSITIPESITYIGRDLSIAHPFLGCSKLKSINVAPQNKNYCSVDGALYNKDKTTLILCPCQKGSINIPSSVTKIAESAFRECSAIKSLTLPNSVEYMGSYVFQGCENLESITIPNSVKSMGDAVFRNCKKLKSITLPSGIKNIYYQTFRDCFSLENVTLSEGLTKIDADAFLNCPNLKTIIIPKSVTQIRDSALGFLFDKQTNKYSQMDDLTILCAPNSEGERYAKDTHFSYRLASRLSGDNRYATAAAISQESYDKSDTVVLAYGMNYADALAGIPLAGNLDAPILLSNKNSLSDETLNEIKRLGAKNVVILGGESVISENIVNTLEKSGINKNNITRIHGDNRYKTAVRIAERSNSEPTDLFLVYGQNFADALSVSTVAAIKNAPIIYLTTNGELTPDTAEYLSKVKSKVKHAYVIGGTSVISDEMMKKAAKALGVKPERIAGKDRFATCIEVNNRFKDVLTGDSVCVATGMDFPDALAGGVYAAKDAAPLFLLNSKLASPKLTDEQKAYLKYKMSVEVTAFGGAKAVADQYIIEISKYSL